MRFNNFLEDAAQYRAEPTILVGLRLMISNPGFRAVTSVRVMQKFNSFHPWLGKLMRIENIRKYGCDIVPGCLIGPGLRIEHPVGIVIGQGVIIGRNCTIGHGCTIGEKYINDRADNRYPVIGNNVTLGANTTIIGDVKIGNCVTTGANSLVITNVRDHETVVGIHK